MLTAEEPMKMITTSLTRLMLGSSNITMVTGNRKNMFGLQAERLGP